MTTNPIQSDLMYEQTYLPTTNYSLTMRLILTMGPLHGIFQVKQKKVYAILFTIFSATEAWVYLKTSRKEKRTRKIFLALYAHYLWPNKVDLLSASLTCTLQNIDYHGKNRSVSTFVSPCLYSIGTSWGRFSCDILTETETKLHTCIWSNLSQNRWKYLQGLWLEKLLWRCGGSDTTKRAYVLWQGLWPMG